MEQGSGRHGTGLTGDMGWGGGKHGTGRWGRLLEFMVFMMNITEEK